MWQVHGKCGKDHTEKRFEKSALAAACKQQQQKENGHLPPSYLLFCFGQGCQVVSMPCMKWLAQGQFHISN